MSGREYGLRPADDAVLRESSSMYQKHRLIFAIAILTAPGSAFGSLMHWDFSNAVTTGDISTSSGISSLPTLSGTITQTGGGPAEDWGGNKVMLARYFGTYTFGLQFSTFDPLLVDHITFQHFHNHNSLQTLSYDLHVQMFTGRAYVDLASMRIDSSNNGAVSSLWIGTMFGPGSYTLRFTASGFSLGPDTGTDFFALDNLAFENGLVNNLLNTPEPATYALVGFGLMLAGRAGRRGRATGER